MFSNFLTDCKILKSKMEVLLKSTISFSPDRLLQENLNSFLGALLEASKLTISFLKGLLVALCIFELNCKQRLIKE